MAERKSISKRIRFEVFKRDSFTCQYCGKKSPDVILELDHIKPVSKGGNNDLLNLVTSCFDCNRGKSNIEIDDDSAIKRKRNELERLQERREQIEMMIEWQETLMDLGDLQTEKIAEHIDDAIGPQFSIHENFKRTIGKLIRSYSYTEVMEAVNIGIDQYLRYENNQATEPTVIKLLNKIPGICKNRKLFEEKPEMKEVYYIRAIVKNNCGYINDKTYFIWMNRYIKANGDMEFMKTQAVNASSWTSFSNILIDCVSELEEVE